ncbi:ferritin-like domain-containing protein [Massariosphaeria phaeospora]|uniref:Ferritin-like domain-containing protein n=1 Tax=Massariosphaeria phaeospora TaxID=100035 RepID=A0A7C8I5X2_9PLEO|nr:ferritin-like domain-containing protein [Massariosphaeria phaeospora]
MKSTIFSLAVLATLSAAAPTKRAAAPPSDGDILNYALTLEHLEDTFYRDALKKFTVEDFKSAGFDEATYNRIKTVSGDEATHVEFLTGALSAAGAKPVEACTYDFGYTDVKTFLATASILEGVGVSAYLGAAADIMSKTYLTAAGSILTVEARHSAYIRNTVGQAPFPAPFDSPLSYNEVYTLAAQFIKSCPSTNAPLPVKAFPTLTASSKDMMIKSGSMVMLATKGYKVEGGEVYAAFITILGPVFVDAKAVDGGYEVVVPKEVSGQSYVVLTSCNTAATDDTIVAGPAVVEVSM